MLNPYREQEIRYRLGAATPRPWKVCPDDDGGELTLVCCGVDDAHDGPICTHPLTPADAIFIADAPQAIADLLAELDRLREFKTIMRRPLSFEE